MLKTLLTILLLILLTRATAQTIPRSFAVIDQRVQRIEGTDAGTLAGKLTAPYKTDLEKVRAIFRWTTGHIAYDTKNYHNPNGAYEGLWERSVTEAAGDIDTDYNNSIVQQVLREKKAVCDGYARLFKTLCDKAKIRCEIITGYIRWHSDTIGQQTNRTHAWNAVWINGEWKLIDATWASGYSDAKVTVFTKAYNELYFCTNPVTFFNDHYPTDSKWSLLPYTPSLQQFYAFPFYFPDLYRSDITSVKPTAGMITVDRKDRLVQIEVETTGQPKELLVMELPGSPAATDTALKAEGEEVAPLDGPDGQDHHQVSIERNRISCRYRVWNENARQLIVLYDGKLIVKYSLMFKG